jgi:predicted LPLAT superfamily acyltransferase
LNAWLEQRERGSIIGIRLMLGLALLLGRPIARLALSRLPLLPAVLGKASTNPALASSVIPLGRADSLFKVQERLHRSSCVGMLGDRTLNEEGQMRVPFLGKAALSPPAPFRIALALKRPVVLMLGLYCGGNRYELYFEKLFEPDGVDRARRAAAIEEAVRLYAQRLEHYCRQAPYNWFNFYDFWKGAR